MTAPDRRPPDGADGADRAGGADGPEDGDFLGGMAGTEEKCGADADTGAAARAPGRVRGPEGAEFSPFRGPSASPGTWGGGSAGAEVAMSMDAAVDVGTATDSEVGARAGEGDGAGAVVDSVWEGKEPVLDWLEEAEGKEGKEGMDISSPRGVDAAEEPAEVTTEEPVEDPGKPGDVKPAVDITARASPGPVDANAGAAAAADSGAAAGADADVGAGAGAGAGADADACSAAEACTRAAAADACVRAGARTAAAASVWGDSPVHLKQGLRPSARRGPVTLVMSCNADRTFATS